MKKIFLIIIGLTISLFANFSRDNMREVITDINTNLEWQDNLDVKNNFKNWKSAIDYCETLILGDKDDWRLANLNEFYSIVNRTKENPSIDDIFVNIAIKDHWNTSTAYWTSTTVKQNPEKAHIISFRYGNENSLLKQSLNHVRCVRNK